MAAKTSHDISAKAASKHMTIGELEAFIENCRRLGAADDAVPKFGLNAWAQTVKSAQLEFEVPTPSESNEVV